MAAITVTRLDVRPLQDCIRDNPVVSGTVYVGDAVYCSGGTVGGSVSQANASAAPNGGTIATTGDRVDVVLYGRVTGFAGLTAGSVVFAGNTVGALDTAAGSVSHKMGIGVDPTTILVKPSNP
jgi:energy-converting hydrogenase Eha subunit B